MEWIRSANTKFYDVIAAFEELNEIDWRKSNFKIEEGDIVYIYVGAPYSKIMFKTVCVNDNVSLGSLIDDKKFYKKQSDAGDVDEFVRLKLISKVDSNKLSLETLNNLGLVKARIQGALKSDHYPELFAYIEKVYSSVV